MATVTPNFNWPVPTSTDLVKDGATAIEALGDSIDASLVDLKGGTTGQILSKASNTDMDFSWTTPNPGDITGVTAGTGISGGGTSGDVTITNSMATTITTKGDLVPGTGSGTFARLAAGSNGETLVADSSTATGLRYQPTMAAGKNTVINGGMDIWQRGTSIAGTTTSFSADRWQSYRGVAGSTFSRQTGTEGIQYCVRVQRDSGNTSTSAIYLAQNFETPNSVPLAGKTITLSFYAKAGADYSRLSSGLTVNLSTGTGTDQNGLTSAYTGSITAINQTATLTTSWQRFSYNATLNTNTNEINITFGFTPVGTAGANDWYEITGVQLEIGSVATQFSRAGGTLAGELAACQRYYTKSYDLATAPATATSNGSLGLAVGTNSAATNYFTLGVTPPVAMRTAPVITLYDLVGNSGKVTTVSATDLSLTDNVTGTADRIGEKAFRVYVAANARGGFYVHYVASAEL